MGGLLTLYFLTPIIILIQTALLKLILKYSRFWIIRKIGKIIQPSELMFENLSFFKGSCVEIFVGFFIQINAYAQHNYQKGEL